MWSDLTQSYLLTFPLCNFKQKHVRKWPPVSFPFSQGPVFTEAARGGCSEAWLLWTQCWQLWSAPSQKASASVPKDVHFTLLEIKSNLCLLGAGSLNKWEFFASRGPFPHLPIRRTEEVGGGETEGWVPKPPVQEGCWGGLRWAPVGWVWGCVLDGREERHLSGSQKRVKVPRSHACFEGCVNPQSQTGPAGLGSWVPLCPLASLLCFEEHVESIYEHYNNAKLLYIFDHTHSRQKLPGQKLNSHHSSDSSHSSDNAGSSACSVPPEDS